MISWKVNDHRVWCTHASHGHLENLALQSFTKGKVWNNTNQFDCRRANHVLAVLVRGEMTGTFTSLVVQSRHLHNKWGIHVESRLPLTTGSMTVNNLATVGLVLFMFIVNGALIIRCKINQ